MPFFDSDAETQVVIGEPVSGSEAASGVLLAGSDPFGTASLLSLSTDGSLKVTGSFSAQVDTITSIIDPVTVTGSVLLEGQPIEITGSVDIGSITSPVTFTTIVSGNNGTTNNTTIVTMVPSPPVQYSRTVAKNGFTITNNDSGSIVFITAKSGSVPAQLIECIRLAPFERWSSEAEVVFTGADFMTVVLEAAVTSSQADWLITFTDNKIL